MNNIFVTGEIGIGKSVVVEKVLKKLNDKYVLKLGGYKGIRVEDINGENIIRNFYISSYRDSSSYRILEYKFIDGEENIQIFLESFDVYSEKLDMDLNDKDLLVLDEIGFAESNCKKYVESLNRALDSEKLVFGVLKKSEDCKFIIDIGNREDVSVFEINLDNRDYIYEDIYNLLCDIIDKK